MNSDEILKAILAISKSRFDVVGPEASLKLCSLAGDEIHDRQVVTLRKSALAAAGNKTILIAWLHSPDDIKYGAKWAACVRDVLPEPEASDLYLILAAEEFSEGICSNLEADEQFCRKYALRPHETPDDMVLRTFLAPLDAKDDDSNIADPVISAMRMTGKGHEWLDGGQQEYWKELFLSDRESSNIASLLIGEGIQEE